MERASALIDGDAFERLAKSLDPLDPYYEETRVKLLELKDETGCLYLYTMAPYTDTVHRFIVDAESLAEGASLGQEEDITGYGASYLRTYETKTIQYDKMSYIPRWGWLISTFLPIVNSSGDIVGVIGCDFEADSIYKSLYSRVMHEIIFVVFFIIVGFILYVSLLKAITAQNRELVEMNAKARAASDSKSAFLARMSHEIRTPMNAIIGMSELVERDCDHPQALEYIQDIKQAGASLLSIINDILDFSKIESGHIQIANERYETASLLNDALAIIRVRLGDKPVELFIDLDPSIPAFMIGDEVRIRQVLINLLSNAEKYTNSGFIRFSANCERMEGDSVNMIFSIADSGIGIKDEDIGSLFGDFSRVDIERNKYIQGTGLGLSITRLLCRAMGGDVTVTSEYGKGSVFTATVRQGCPNYSPMVGILGKTHSDSGSGEVPFTAPDFRVLIVDDIATNLKVVEGLLAPYMMAVDTCLSGQEAVNLVKENHYDLVLMDHMMPDMDGIEATAAIRSLGGRFKELTIVALTANAVSGMREMFLENGFDDFLPKPLEISKLKERVEKWVSPDRRRSARVRDKSRESGKFGMAQAEGASISSVVIDGLDIAAGISSFSAEEIYIDILRTYAEQTPKLLDRIRAVERGDLTNYAIIVHGIKGSSSGVCAFRAAKMAEALELSAKRGDFDAVWVKNGEFIKTVEKLLADIAAMLKGTSPLPKKERLAAPSHDLLGTLFDCCERYDTLGMNGILSELEKYEYESDGELVEWISAKVNDLEYDEIKDRLEKFRKRH
ncbi:MAG: response regulator [Synergistaceae bacterium]|nr:response regulator [Synergistaceae bacterium]